MIKVDSNKFMLALAKAAMTTEELKVKSGVGRNTISRILNGETAVRPVILGKLAKALNVDVTEIIAN